MAIDLLAKPSANDILYGWIQDLFDGSPVIAKVFALYTSTLGIFGALTLGFFIIVGIVSSASSGKVLGERYHQIWAPLRVVLGFGLLIPIAGGFSTVHYLLKEPVARGSINLANAPWVLAAEEVFGKGASITPYRYGGMDLVLNIVEHELCGALVNEYIKLTGAWPTQPVILPPSTGKEEGWGVWTSKSQVWDYGPRCGQFKFPLHEDKDAFNLSRKQVIVDTIEAVRPHMPAYGLHVNKYGVSGDKATVEKIGPGAMVMFQLLQKLGAEADSRIAAAASREAMAVAPESRERIVQTAGEKGLLSMGSFALSFSQNSRLTDKLANEQIENIAPSISKEFDLMHREAMKIIRAQLGLGAQYAPATANDLAAAADSESGVVTRMLAPVFRNLFEFITTGERQTSAFAHIAETGQSLKGAATAIIVGGGVVKAWSGNALGSVTGAKATVDWFLSWAGFGAMMLFALGWMRADLFPMIPFIMMIIIGARILLDYIRAMIGGPLWAFSFIRMDGPDFIEQKQAAGINKLLELFFRPVFYVLGFLTSIMIFDQVYSFINTELATAFWATRTSVPDPVDLISFYVFDTILSWSLIFTLFGHIGNIVDDIMEWLGISVRSPSLGQEMTTAALAANAAANKAPDLSGGAMDAVAATTKKFAPKMPAAPVAEITKSRGGE